MGRVDLNVVIAGRFDPPAQRHLSHWTQRLRVSRAVLAVPHWSVGAPHVCDRTKGVGTRCSRATVVALCSLDALDALDALESLESLDALIAFVPLLALESALSARAQPIDSDRPFLDLV